MNQTHSLAPARLMAFAIILVGIAADQLSKIWVLANLPGRPRTIIEGALSFVYAENRNMAFGLGESISPSIKAWGLILLTSSLALGLLVWIWRLGASDWKFRVCLSLIASGAIGNIIDRVRLGFVVDFIYWHGGFTWPNFNVADSFICVGAALMFIFSFQQDIAQRRASKPASAPTPDGSSGTKP
ncbi:MAG: signal peptidase II [Myxococcales bacterium]|jgi:signal peptidase II|nr:signal peptidase II [Myxococcales bacterium]